MTNNSIKKSIGRPKTFEKDDVIRLAMNHFWKNGYETTSLDDLLLSMGIKKSSFYRTFKSKEEVFFLALDLYRQDMIGIVDSLKGELGYKKTLIYVIKNDIDELFKIGYLKGCLLLDVSKESYIKYGKVNDHIQKEVEFFKNFVIDFIKEAQDFGELSKKITAEHLAIRYLALYTGIINTIQATNDINIVDDLLVFVEELLV